MPPTYPNLDHPYFFFSSTSGQSSTNPSTRLSSNVVTLIEEDISSGYDFRVEREVLERMEKREEEEEKEEVRRGKHRRFTSEN